MSASKCQRLENGYGQGKRIGVLLFHGLTGMPSELRPLAKSLQRQGFYVECPLIAGHGGTHQDLLKTSWKDWLEAAQQSLQSLQDICDEVYVGGLSMGAMLAVALAVDNPQIKGLLLLSPHMGGMQDNLQSTQWLLPVGAHLKPLHGHLYWTEKPPYGLKDQRLQRKIEQALHSSQVGETSNYGLYRTYIGSIYQMLDLIRFCKTHAFRVDCPALILQSFEDTITKIENATCIYSLLGSSCKMIRMFSGCDHVMTVDLRKKDVSNWCAEFIQAHSHIKIPLESGSVAVSYEQLHVEIIPGFVDLSRDEWGQLTGLSDSEINILKTELSYRYDERRLHSLLVRHGKEPLLYIPIFLNHMKDGLNGLELPSLQFRWLKQVGSSCLSLGLPDFFMNHPAGLGVNQGAVASLLSEALERAFSAVEAFRESLKIPTILLNMMGDSWEPLRLLLQHQGYAQFFEQNVSFNPVEVHSDFYFMKLVSESRLSIHRTRDIHLWVKDIQDLAAKTLKSNNAVYYEAILERHANAEYVLYFYDEQLIAWNLLFHEKDRLYEKQFCMEPLLGRLLNLPYRAWEENKRFCERHGCEYQSAFDSGSLKSTLSEQPGCRMWAVKHSNSWIQSLWLYLALKQSNDMNIQCPHWSFSARKIQERQWRIREWQSRKATSVPIY